MAISAARYSTSTFFKAKVVSLSLPMYRLRVYGSNMRSQRASLSVFGTKDSTQLVTMERIR
jgi:hypothetical protein